MVHLREWNGVVQPAGEKEFLSSPSFSCSAGHGFMRQRNTHPRTRGSHISETGERFFGLEAHTTLRSQ